MGKSTILEYPKNVVKPDNKKVRSYGQKLTLIVWVLNKLESYKSVLDFQQEMPGGRHSWFGFSMVVKKVSPFSAEELRNYLERKGIETRPIISGDMTQQPALRLYDHRSSNSLENSNNVMKNGLLIGCHQDLKKTDLKYIYRVFDNFFKKLK